MEEEFEKRFGSLATVDFMGPVSFFLRIKFQWRCRNNHIECHMSQRAFIEALLQQHGLHPVRSTTKNTPYRTGSLVDTVQIPPSLTPTQHFKLQSLLQSLVGSFHWMAQATRPDLATITSILAQHQANPAPGHIGAAWHVL